MRVRIVSPEGKVLNTEVHLDDILDVEINNPVEDGSLLKFDAATQTWRKALSEVSGGYIDRGDPASYDFSKADFSTDGQWHVLDLSNIVPAGTTLVHLSIGAVIAYANSYIQFRKNGIVNDINKKIIVILFGNKEYYEDAQVACDADRKIEYWMSDRTWVTLDMLVRGWMN